MPNPASVRSLALVSLAVVLAAATACSAGDDTPGDVGGTAGTGGSSGGVGGTGGVLGGSGGMVGGTGGVVAGAGGVLGGSGGGLGGGPLGGGGGVVGGAGGVLGGAGGDAGSASGAGGTPPCGANLEADAAHCSACDDPCAAGFACVGLVCVGSAANVYSLELGDPSIGEVRLDVNVAGGKVTGFALDGSNLLTDSAVNDLNFGSTMWTSPQSGWNGCWPPPTAIDQDAYQASVAGNALTLTSPNVTPNCGPNVRVTKVFTPDAATRSVRMDFTITNAGATSVELAAWQVTRVPTTGIGAWPEGSRLQTGGVPAQATNGTVWLSSRPAQSGTNIKLFADGAGGWMAYAVGTALLVKTWADVAPEQQFSDEAEIEVYEGSGYRELEVQGPRTTLQSGAETTFTITWYLRRLPAPVVATGDAAMLAAVAEIVGG